MGLRLGSAFNRIGPLPLVLAAAKFVMTAAFSDRYGYHRDELYYIACARHLQLGYVDFPPVTPLLGRLVLTLFGPNLVALRVLPELVGAAIVVLAAVLALQLHGSRGAAALASAIVFLNPLYIAGNLLFQTVVFDQLAWVLACVAFVALINRNDRRSAWLVLGAVLGLGLETKYTILALAIGIVVGVLVTPLRRELRTPWPLLGAAIAVLILVPNVVWQVQHGWPSIQYTFSHSSRTGSRLDFVAGQLLYAGAFTLPILIVGAVHLYRSGRYRPVFWAAVAVFVIFLLASGKPYYVGPIYPLLAAAGAVAIAGWVEGRVRLVPRVLVAAQVLFDIVALPVGLPVLPASVLAQTQLYKARTDFADMFGWHELAQQVASARNGLAAADRGRVQVVAANYGEAGAIDLYGSQYGLPHALSPHLTYFYWKPSNVDFSVVIAVGFDEAFLQRGFRTVVKVGVITNDYGVRNEEYGRPIFICRDPKVDLNRAWAGIQEFD